jgi:hypothetical protein
MSSQRTAYPRNLMMPAPTVDMSPDMQVNMGPIYSTALVLVVVLVT